MLSNEAVSRFLLCKDLLTLDLKYYEKTHCKYKRNYNMCNILSSQFIVNLSLYDVNVTILNDLLQYTELFRDRIHNIKQF